MVTIRNLVLLVLPGLCGCVGSDPVSTEVPEAAGPAVNVTASVVPVSLVPCHVEAALKEVGRLEEGNNDGEHVRMYLASVGLGPGYPWCAAFVHWAFRECGQVFSPERPFAMARSWAVRGEVWRHGQEEMEWDGRWGHAFERTSEDGDLFTLYYANLKRIGHVGIITGEDEDYVFTVEGNTNAQGSREGNGVWRRKRLKSSLHSINRWS